jgi:hypothetical protein
LTARKQKDETVASLPVFLRRLLPSLGFSFGLMGIALFIGISGYHLIAGFNWVDSILEASMILAGMGPVNTLPTASAKLFASAYALFSGVIFIGVIGIILGPFVHRVLHKFHLEGGNPQK